MFLRLNVYTYHNQMPLNVYTDYGKALPRGSRPRHMVLVSKCCNVKYFVIQWQIFSNEIQCQILQIISKCSDILKYSQMKLNVEYSEPFLNVSK